MTVSLTARFESIPTTWYFIIATMTTVGYGDHYPVTPFGKLIAVDLAGGENVILLHPPLPLVGVSIWTEREHQQNDRTLANG